MLFQKQRAKRWMKKLLKRGKREIIPVEPSEYMHKTDRVALEALKRIPMFDKLCGKMISVIDEPLRCIEDMSSKIRISEEQIPRVYYMVENICRKLDIEMPNLYLELDRDPNAYTYGHETISITLTSGLLECLEDDEIYAVLAHECGHIACEHVLYHTMGNLVLGGSSAGVRLLDTGFIGSLVTAPLKLAFHHWMRCSELSADRAAMICCEGSRPVIDMMMRLAGGTKHLDAELNAELFLQQAEDYDEMKAESLKNKLLEYLYVYDQSHPLLSVRAHEAKLWEETEEYFAAVDKLNGVLVIEEPEEE